MGLSPNSVGSLFDKDNTRIEEILSKQIDTILPTLDPIWRDTVVSSQGVGAVSEFSKDFQVDVIDQNDPPTLEVISALAVLENSEGPLIAFTASDEDDPDGFAADYSLLGRHMLGCIHRPSRSRGQCSLASTKLRFTIMPFVFYLAFEEDCQLTNQQVLLHPLQKARQQIDGGQTWN